MPADDTFHRWDGDYFTRRDWPGAPPVQDRIRRALGPYPIDSARHLLGPIVYSAPASVEPGQPSGFERLPDDSRLDLRLRLARSIEMRLVAAGRRFPSRDVWRNVYALGLTWGDMDVFHWLAPRSASLSTGPRERYPEFTISAAGAPAYFLPERAEEGETVAGLLLSFELPTCPAPLAVFDRMAIALGYLRQQLGGRPTAANGADLDHDQLYADRDALAETVREMAALGVPPGSAAAARLL